MTGSSPATDAAAPLAAVFTPPTDVELARERWKQARARRLLLLLGLLFVLAIYRIYLYVAGGQLLSLHLHVPSSPYLVPTALIVVLLLLVAGPGLLLGRSPHVRFNPQDIPVGFDDVRGLGPELEDVRRTLEIFEYRDRFETVLGGQARKGVLFEGPPGTGKTLMAKAMAAEAGVPFLYASASSFQAMYYGQTNRKIRSFFRALRAAAVREGGAIGFIDEFDALGTARSNMGRRGSDGVTGVVSELLVQMQSFEVPSLSARLQRRVVGLFPRLQPLWVRVYVPNILLVAATNRAADLDPALMRPGRFDRIISFGIPSRVEREELVDYFLSSRAHQPELDLEVNRARIAVKTMGFTPAMIERLFDESLVLAARAGRGAMSFADLEEAFLTVSIGLARQEPYPAEQRRAIAVHEAGHAVVAWASGHNRVVEMVSILKRGASLGATLHAYTEESFVETRSDLHAMVRIAFAGMVAEEVILGEASSGGAADLVSATQVGARCVGLYGLEGMHLSMDAIGGVGGDETARVMSDKRGRELLENLLNGLYSETASLVRMHRSLVEELASTLEAREELTRHELEEIFAAYGAGILDLRDR